MSDLKDILQDDDGLKQEDLLRYLEGKTSAEERYAIEKRMADSEFINDAVEGLQDFQDKRKLDQYARQLNLQLQKQTSKGRRNKRRRQLNSQQWTLITIVTILLLCILAYWVIRIYQHNG
ncbi:MAG: hypothetical protein ACN4EP_03390 [Sediminibacterium sp.]|nr:hypothetical protein [uncultured Sediminibacterium sp.]